MRCWSWCAASPSSPCRPSLTFPLTQHQARGVLAEIIREAGDVVLQSSPAGRERETVTDQVMEVNMTATLGVRETSCVAATTVSSSDCITTPKMTAVRSPQQSALLPHCLSRESSWSLHQVQKETSSLTLLFLFKERNAAAGTTKAGGVVLPPVPAMSARETVTGRATEVNMTATEAAGRASSVGATTASSSELTSIPRTTAVRDPMGAEVSLCSAMTILRPEWCRLGAVGAVVLLLPLLWGRPVDQEQVLQGPGLSSHNFLSDQNMQQSALPALATVSLCSPRTLPTARLPTSTASSSWVPSTTSWTGTVSILSWTRTVSTSS